MALHEQLLELIRQLEQLGYQPVQINQIIEEEIGMIHWERVSPATQQELIESLENHIFFALRCRQVKS